MASRTAVTVSTLCLSPEANVVALRGATMPGLPEVAQARLAVHVDGAHLDVDGARLQVLKRAARARDDLLDVVGGGDDREDDVCFGGDLGRAGGDGSALPGQFGRAATPVAGDVEAAHHQVPGDGQAHLAQADHAHSIHRCLLAAVAWYHKLYAVWRPGSRGCGRKLHAVWRLAGRGVS